MRLQKDTQKSQEKSHIIDVSKIQSSQNSDPKNTSSQNCDPKNSPKNSQIINSHASNSDSKNIDKKKEKKKAKQKKRKKEKKVHQKLNPMNITIENEKANEKDYDVENDDDEKDDDDSEIFLWEEVEEEYNLEEELKEIELKNPKKKAKRDVKKFSKQDIYKYICASIIMGLKRLPDYLGHWSKTKWYRTELLQKLMTKNQFQEIHKYFHFDVDLVAEKCCLNFKKIYNCNKMMSVDECLSGWSGRSKFKMYMPSKPDKYGLKFFCLADSNGYVYDFFLYKGKDSKRPTETQPMVEQFAKIAPRESIIFMDNYFGGLELANNLNEQKTYFVMNCKGCRPTFLFKEGLQASIHQKGDTCGRYNSAGIFAFSKSDKKMVNFLSNCFDNEKKKITIKNKLKKEKEYLITMYNCGMGGVDLSDSFLHQIKIFPHRKYKWTRCLFFTVLSFILDNSWIFWGIQNQKHETKKDFLENIVQQICREFKIDMEMTESFCKKNQHWPQHVPIDENGKSMQKKCIFCGTSTSYFCMGCGVALHPDCWIDYHTQTFKKYMK